MFLQLTGRQFLTVPFKRGWVLEALIFGNIQYTASILCKMFMPFRRLDWSVDQMQKYLMFSETLNFYSEGNFKCLIYYFQFQRKRKLCFSISLDKTTKPVLNCFSWFDNFLKMVYFFLGKQTECSMFAVDLKYFSFQIIKNWNL